MTETTKAETVVIPPEFQRLQHAASKDETRFNIFGVYFNGAHAVATDGHIMAVRRKSEENMPENTILRFASPKAKKRICHAFEKTGSKYIGISQNELAETIDGRYPAWKQVLPEISPNSVSITFSAALLNRLVNAIGSNFDQNGCVLTFDPSKPTAPMLVTTDERECFGVLMPMRGEGDPESGQATMNRVLK